MADKKEETPANGAANNDGTGGNNQGNPPGNEGASGTPSGNGTGGTGDTTEEIRKVVREEIAEALKGIKPGATGDGTPAPNRGNIEAAAEEMVRKAAEKLEAEKQHKADHEKIREGVKPPETAPQKARRLTRALWGSDDK